MAGQKITSTNRTRESALLPTHVLIGPYLFEVCENESAIYEAAAFDGVKHADLYGRIDFRHQKIAVHPDQGQDMRADSIVHECLHALIHANGGFEPEKYTEEEEERIVSMLSPLFVQFIRNNPALIQFVVDTKPEFYP